MSDKKRQIIKEIFLGAGNAVLAGGIGALGTTHLPAVLPSVFVGALCFQILQQMWKIKKRGEEINFADLAKNQPILEESLHELKFTKERHFKQIETALLWMNKAIDNLGDRMKFLEIDAAKQKGKIDNILNITDSHEKLIKEIALQIEKMKPPQEIGEALSLGSGIALHIDRKKLQTALSRSPEGVLEDVIGKLNAPSSILSGRSASPSARVNDLLSWAENLSGPGLDKVYLAFLESTNPH